MTLDLPEVEDDEEGITFRGLCGHVAKTRFRDFSAHMREKVHRDAHAFREWERNRTIIFCKACNTRWVFSDVAIRQAPHVLDYLWESGLPELVAAVLQFHPQPGAWNRVLLGFLDET